LKSKNAFDLILGKLTALLKNKNRLTPPPNKTMYDKHDFKKIGNDYLAYFIKYCHLKPEDKILDIGCGIGRMAIPLTTYISPNGSYDGFDIIKDNIEWCSKNITKQFSNFRFKWINILNNLYNPSGTERASEVQFPYDNNSFDFIFLTSVFTHMLPDDMEHYFSEISRILKKNGKCLSTFFLLNDETSSLIKEGKSTRDFIHEYKEYRLLNHKIPEAAICYKEEYILNLFVKNKLSIIKPIHYGAWRGKKSLYRNQDIIIASKK